MPTEDELRRQLHGDEPHGAIDGGTIDLQAVLRRASRRRAPRVAAVAIVTSLAAIGIVVPVSISLASSHTTTTSLSAGSAASATDSSGVTNPEASGGGIKRAPAGKINLCTGQVAAPALADDGLVLSVQPVDAAASDRDIPVTVTLTNTGAQQVSGYLSPFPTVTLSRDGIVLWHSNGAVPSLAQQIDLAPGASTSFETTFEPVVCAVEDDTRDAFRTDLPDAGPGAYQLSAALDFNPQTADDGSGGSAVLVTGPTSLVTLH